jgi:hypothetical protein
VPSKREVTVDIGRAFAFVFDDPEWVKKILIGGAISLVPVVGSFIVYGYMLEIARRSFAASGDDLPEWDDVGGMLASGFILWLGYMIWFLPVVLLILCFVFAMILTGVASGSDAVIGLSFLFAFMVFMPLIFLVSILAAVIQPLLLGRYAIERRFGALFEFGAILAEARLIGAVPLLLLLVTVLAAQSIGSLGFVLCFIGVIFTSFYASLVTAHGAGQVYRRARALTASPSSTSPPAA